MGFTRVVASRTTVDASWCSARITITCNSPCRLLSEHWFSSDGACKPTTYFTRTHVGGSCLSVKAEEIGPSTIRIKREKTGCLYSRASAKGIARHSSRVLLERGLVLTEIDTHLLPRAATKHVVAPNHDIARSQYHRLTCSLPTGPVPASPVPCADASVGVGQSHSDTAIMHCLPGAVRPTLSTSI